MERDKSSLLGTAQQGQQLSDDQKVRYALRTDDRIRLSQVNNQLDDEERELRNFFADVEPTQSEDPTLISKQLH